MSAWKRFSLIRFNSWLKDRFRRHCFCLISSSGSILIHARWDGQIIHHDYLGQLVPVETQRWSEWQMGHQSAPSDEIMRAQRGSGKIKTFYPQMIQNFTVFEVGTGPLTHRYLKGCILCTSPTDSFASSIDTEWNIRYFRGRRSICDSCWENQSICFGWFKQIWIVHSTSRDSND